MGPGDLSRALAPLPRHTDPRILVGAETFDDAGVFRIAEGLALVQTVDFFAPVVDDPYDFGQIAAANALSDVYAMGGEPITALNLVAFPTGTLPLEILSDILRGGHDKVREAGAHVIGGHSVVDDEPKFGLAVTGTVHPDRMLTNATAKPGDRLVLTKPIGSGILTTALKQEKVSLADAADALDAMRRLNAHASRMAVEVGVRCATDITGFGLLGHASHIARASNVSLRIDIAAVPRFAHAERAWRDGATTGGAARNLEYLEPLVAWGRATEMERALLVDPQTSGGLFVAVPESRVADYVSSVPGAVVVGEVLPRGELLIDLA